MSASNATKAVADRIRTVANVGHVYDLLGNPTSEVDFKNRYVDGNKVLAWEVTREGSVPTDPYAQATNRKHEIAVYGFMSFQEGVSEPLFQALVDAICAEFDPLGPLDGFPNVSRRRFPSVDFPDGEFDGSSSLIVDGPRMAFRGNLLMHFVRMSCFIDEFPIV